MSQVSLDESRMTQILKDNRFLEEFPFLKGAATALKTKGCRCGRSAVNKARDYGHLKATIARMPTAKKARFKELLGASEVSLTYVNERRLKVLYTF